MNKFVSVVALVCALFSVPAAHGATAFNYSYTFADGSIVKGGFTGNASGNLITDLSGISVLVNGVAFSGNGSLFAAGIVGSEWYSGAGVASFDGLQNNFLFADSDFPWVTSYTNIFYNTYSRNQEAYMESSQASNWDDLSNPSYAGDNWSVWTASDIPEPAPVLLLAIGGVGLALARRRKRS